MYTKKQLEKNGVEALRDIMRELDGTPRNMKKHELINAILMLQNGEIEPDKTNLGRKPRNEKAEEDKQYKENNEYVKDDISETEVKEDFNEVESEFVSTISVKVSGILEFHEQGYGFMRGENYEGNQLTDVFVGKNIIKT